MNKYTLLVLITLALTLVSGCGDKPDKVVREYLERIMVGKIREATYLCTGDAFDITKSAEGAEGAGKGFNYLVITDWTEIEPTLEFKVDKTAADKADVTVYSNGTEAAVYSLIKKNGKWVISEAPFPGETWASIMEAIRQ